MKRNITEQAYAFFHQKEKVYARSSSESERDHIEESIASYVNAMSRDLYDTLSGGNDSYLMEHPSFASDLSDAISKLEGMLR